MTGKFIIRAIRSGYFGGLKHFTAKLVPNSNDWTQIKMSPLTLSVEDAILLMVSSPSISAGNIRLGA